MNNIHTIAISGVTWDGSVPGYTEQCAAIMAVAYGKDMFTYRTDGNVKPPLVSYDQPRGLKELGHDILSCFFFLRKKLSLIGRKPLNNSLPE